MRETSLDEWVGGAAGEDADGDATDEDEPDVEDAVDEVEDPADDGEDAVDSSADVEPDEVQQDVDERDDAEPESDPELESVEPAVSTYDWTPTGADCEACGAAVERRWRDDGRLVCADCKAW